MPNVAKTLIRQGDPVVFDPEFISQNVGEARHSKPDHLRLATGKPRTVDRDGCLILHLYTQSLEGSILQSSRPVDFRNYLKASKMHSDCVRRSSRRPNDLAKAMFCSWKRLALRLTLALDIRDNQKWPKRLR